MYALMQNRNSIIAITGLDGHAYGSWRGKRNLCRMWLRDFLSKDLRHCRTMVYGYNSKLSSHGIDTILDYGREFLEEIKKVRYTQEVRLDHTIIFESLTVQTLRLTCLAMVSLGHGRCFSSPIVLKASF